jgi:hypothetical protein
MTTPEERKGAKDPFAEKRKKDLEETFKPYGIALARLVFHWNRLHEALALLFVTVVNTTEHAALMSPYREVPLAIWHSAKSDFTQREMLRGAADKSPHLSPEQQEDIKEMLNKIDRGLRPDRNAATHAPLSFAEEVVGNTSQFSMHVAFSNSEHAERLRPKEDLVSEFNHYADLAECLERYVQEMYGALLHAKNPIKDSQPFPIFPWPTKPKWPQKENPKGSKS